MTQAHWILFIFLTVDAIALMVLLIYKFRRELRRSRIRHFGDRAEEQVSSYIREMFPDAVLFNDLFLKTPFGITQIDHVLLCKWGIYVIETKSHNGRINVNRKEWVQIYGEKVIRFHSPLLQNETHCKALEALLNQNRAFRGQKVHGVVVFTSKKVHFSKRISQVIRLEELGGYVKNGRVLPNHRSPITARPGGVYLSRQKILSLEKWIRKNSVRSRRKKSQHESRVRKMDRNRYLV